MTLLALLGCADEAMKPYAQALDAYEEGAAALDAGRPADAVEAFARARKADPRSASLVLWEAKALADAGRLADADAALSALIREEPTLAQAWYNRAAWRVRAGRVDEAAVDLKEALRLGARSAIQAAADPDFAAVRGQGPFAALLPPAPLVALAKAPEGAVFVQSDLPIDVYVEALPDAELALTRLAGDPGCLRLARIVEDDRDVPGSRLARVTLTFRGEGPCGGPVGPFRVAAGADVFEVPAVEVKVEAPPGAPEAPAPPLPGALPLPGQLVAEDARWVARRVEDGVVAVGRADRTPLGNGRRPDVVLEWRVEGQTRAAGGWWREAGPVTVVAGDFEETVP